MFFQDEWHFPALSSCCSILNTNSRNFGRKSEKCSVEQAIQSVASKNAK